MQPTTPELSRLAQARVRIPQHVVYRSFPAETVMLNLQTGRYHGLNATAGRMLDELGRHPHIHEAVATVAAEYEQPTAVVERDMCELCQVLLERGLLEIDESPEG